MIDALLHREHTPYREIGERAVAHVMDRAGIRHTMDEVRGLVEQIERLRPFPEVPAALARLRTRYRLVVLSNGDPDMLEAAKPYHGVAFDRIISVAAANSFKPHVATYTKAAEIVGVPMRPGAVRRQPRVRLHRREGGRHAHRVHRPPQPSVRRDAAPARPAGAQHDRTRRRHRLMVAYFTEMDITVTRPRTSASRGRSTRAGRLRRSPATGRRRCARGSRSPCP